MESIVRGCHVDPQGRQLRWGSLPSREQLEMLVSYADFKEASDPEFTERRED
jgi:hypothetical protein